MGRTVTPTFVVDYQDQLGWHRSVWTSGAPTEANLEKWRVALNASMKLGSCNEHVSLSLGFMPHCSKAIIRNQKTGNLNVATVRMPMFETC